MHPEHCTAIFLYVGTIGILLFTNRLCALNTHSAILGNPFVRQQPCSPVLLPNRVPPLSLSAFHQCSRDYSVGLASSCESHTLFSACLSIKLHPIISLHPIFSPFLPPDLPLLIPQGKEKTRLTCHFCNPLCGPSPLAVPDLLAIFGSWSLMYSWASVGHCWVC
jgi:hypothetical protein